MKLEQHWYQQKKYIECVSLLGQKWKSWNVVLRYSETVFARRKSYFNGAHHHRCEQKSTIALILKYDVKCGVLVLDDNIP